MIRGYIPLFFENTQYDWIFNKTQLRCGEIVANHPYWTCFFFGGGKGSSWSIIPKKILPIFGTKPSTPPSRCLTGFSSPFTWVEELEKPIGLWRGWWRAGSLERKNGARHCFGNSNHQMFGCWYVFEDSNEIQDYLGALPLGGYRLNIAKPKANQQFNSFQWPNKIWISTTENTQICRNQTRGKSAANHLGSVSFSIPKNWEIPDFNWCSPKILLH